MSDKQRCETCRHWKSDKYRSRGTCNALWEKHKVFLPPKYAYADNDAWLDEIETAPDFGCVLWEPHDEPQGQ